MISLSEIIDEEKNVDCVEDERVVSNLHITSYSKSLKAIENDPKRKDEFIEMNCWLKDAFPECDTISAISGDQLKERLAGKEIISQGVQSCDAFLLLKEEFRQDEYQHHLMIEFKNTDRNTAIEFLNHGNDSVQKKCRNMVQMFKNNIYFYEEGDGEAIISNTHFALVYGGKATGVKSGPGNLVGDKNKGKGENPIKKSWKNSASKSDRRQKRAANMKRESSAIPKRDSDILSQFSISVAKYGYASATKEYMRGGEPAFLKEKSGIKERPFTLMAATDMARLYESGFFDKMLENYGDIE